MGFKHDLVVIVHNVRSLLNVGSVFRTADGAGVSKLFLTGYTPLPVDEMGRYRREVEKTALGSERTLPWERVHSLPRLIESLKNRGYEIIALEQAPRAVMYDSFKPRFPTALIIGNEVRGLSPALLKKCDAIIMIPMRGKKESLNVAVAFGIAVYALSED